MAPFLCHLFSTLNPDDHFATEHDDKMVLNMINPVFTCKLYFSLLSLYRY